MMRTATYEDLNNLCRGIRESFVHLETRDAYGTEVELPHMAKWARGEPDDYAWLGWWLDMLRGHRTAGRTCRRARVVSEPQSTYQQWTRSHVNLFTEAGEDIRYVGRSRLVDILLPGSGDFYVFDGTTAQFLHYAGTGTNASFEITEDPRVGVLSAEPSTADYAEASRVFPQLIERPAMFACSSLAAWDETLGRCGRR